MTWNPRYIAFAKAHGRTPEQQQQVDADLWPGGPGAGFHFWIMQNLHEAWSAKHPSVIRTINGLTVGSQEHWDAWLNRDNPSRIPEDL